MRLSLPWLALVVVSQLLLPWAAAQQRPRMGLCITGQLMRMELWSKLVNLVRPNMHDYDMDVLFVLDPESNLAVNERRNKGLPSTVLNESDLVAHVSRFCPTCTTSVDFYTQPKKPVVAHNYVLDLDKGPRNFTAVRANRAMVHARLFHSWSRCLAGFTRDPKADYDVFVRVRDDLVFPMPIAITRDMWEDAVAVMDFCGWTGFNDKAALVDAKFAHQYFVNPLSNMLLYYDQLRSMLPIIKNPESVLRASLLFDRVPARLLGVDQFPFLVTRRKQDGSICFADSVPKVGPQMSCIAPAVRTFFQRFRCAQKTGMPDTADWWTSDKPGQFISQQQQP